MSKTHLETSWVDVFWSKYCRRGVGCVYDSEEKASPAWFSTSCGFQLAFEENL